MSKKQQNEKKTTAKVEEPVAAQENTEEKTGTPKDSGESGEVEALREENEELKATIAKEKDDYLRLMADFENFRRHSAEAKLELVSTASADIIKGLLPVLDDCERAMKMLSDADDKVAVEGTELIYNKLMSYLKTKGLEVIKAKDEKFDTDFHEAIALIDAPTEEQKGKILDCVQKGYTLNDKVIRHAKVVIGK